MVAHLVILGMRRIIDEDDDVNDDIGGETKKVCSFIWPNGNSKSYLLVNTDFLSKEDQINLCKNTNSMSS